MNKVETTCHAQHHFLRTTAVIPITQRVRVGKMPALGTPQNSEVWILGWKGA